MAHNENSDGTTTDITVYDEAFKCKAVAKRVELGSVRAAALAMNVSRQTLTAWCKDSGRLDRIRKAILDRCGQKAAEGLELCVDEILKRIKGGPGIMKLTNQDVITYFANLSKFFAQTTGGTQTNVQVNISLEDEIMKHRVERGVEE